MVVIGLLCYGFFPQSFVQTVTPVLRNYLTTDRNLTDMECGHGKPCPPWRVSPSFTEQHRPSASTQPGSYNVWPIVRR